MKKIYLLLTIFCILIGCKRNQNTVDFTWSPTTPSAGRAISITNQSTSGEEWEWSFGDMSSSASKNPKKTYLKPGTYTITLTVDKKKYWRCSHTITVVDTIPSFHCRIDSLDSLRCVPIYEPISFTASIYNPYGHTIAYRWDNGDSTATTTRIFHDACDSTELTLTIHDTKTDSTYHIARKYHVVDVPAPALVYRAGDDILRQRRYGSISAPLYENIHRSNYPESDRTLIEATTDASWTADRHVYYRNSKGLCVSDMQGENEVCICPETVHFITGSKAWNRIYWATDEAVLSLPLIQSANNQFKREDIDTVCHYSGIDRIAIDLTNKPTR